MKKISLILLVLLLFACSKTSIKEENALLATSLKKRELPLKTTLNNRQDLIDAFDYLAFYRIREKVYFKVTNEYAKKIESLNAEFEEAYQAADLADVYAATLDDSRYQNEQLLGIKYSLTKDIASQKQSVKLDRIVKNYDYDIHPSKVFNLPIEEKEGISCSTSEQLYYLAMHNYKPLPVKGSIAEELYNKAKEVIFTHVREDDDSFIKIKKIYDYLASEIYYDKETSKSKDPSLSLRQSYYLEGVFLNKVAVCDGKAKAYALLLNMLGIPCLRTTGVSYKGDHAWNLVQYDNKWYLSCTTSAQKNYVKQIDVIMSDYQSLLFAKNDFGPMKWSYVPQKHLDIAESVSDEGLPIYKMLGQNKYNFEVLSVAEVSAILEKLDNQFSKDQKIEFKYLGNEVERFEKKLKKIFADRNDIMILKVSRGDTIYQLLK